MTYTDTLKDELKFTQGKLKSCSKEGLWVLKLQIQQIKRDIERNSTSE